MSAKLKTTIKVLSILTLFALYVLFINNNYVRYVNSDMASELVLAKGMADEGLSFFINNWYFSTTIQVLSPVIIFWPLFMFIESFKIVEIVGSVICMAIMLGSTYYFFKKAKIKNIFWMLVILLIPFSSYYFGMYIEHPYYIFGISAVFVNLGLIINILETNKKWKRIVSIILVTLISFIHGIEGLRLILCLYIPLLLILLVAILINYYSNNKSENIKYLISFGKVSLIPIISSIVGYLFNSVILSKILTFENYNVISYKGFTFYDLDRSINAWLEDYGFMQGTVFSTATFHNIVTVIIIFLGVFVVVYNFKHKDEIKKESLLLTFVYTFGFGLLTLVTVFIGFGDMGRYNFPVVLLLFPLIIDFLENTNVFKINNRIIIYSLLGLIVLCGIDNYRYFSKDEGKNYLYSRQAIGSGNYTIELNEIVEKLVKEGYKTGYSYFWNGNVINVLSNGQIDMRVWGHGEEKTKELTDVDEVYKWLQRKDHEITKPEGKVFVILRTSDELATSKLIDKLDWNNVIHNSDYYTVYGFNSYDELKKAVNR